MNEYLSHIPGNISSTYQSDKQINNKPESVITEMGSENGRVLTSGGKVKYFTVTTCCNLARQCLLPVLIFHGRKKKDDFGDRLPPGQYVHMNWKSSYTY